MADDSLDQTPKADGADIDLSSLSSFSLGPNWGSGEQPKTRLPRETFDEDRRGLHAPRKDRRGAPARKRPHTDRDRRGPQSDRDHGEKRDHRDRGDRDVRTEPFKPILAVDFYPEEEPFKVLSQAIKTSCRTFELFEIARLILEKPDRFVCVARDPLQKEGEPAKLWACVPDGLPFQSEEEAMAHTFRHYLSEFFTMETVEGDAPAGSFQMVHKCGMTGQLLAPPNYHRYQAICREHHASKLSHVPYPRFEQRIESSREQEDIQAWLQSMRTQTRYISKENPETVFENLEDARLYLLTQAKDKLVRPAYSARFSGKSLALLNPGSPVRRSVEFLLEGQKRFPLDTANHLRGRLRRMHFAVYKRGSKGVSYVCAVKRHFRKPEEVLADNMQKLVEFIEARPNFHAKDLPAGYLGTEASKADPDALKKLKADLHYLVSQGYVIEYSDGRLFVPPIREDEVRHLEKLKAKEETTETETAPTDPTGEASDAEPPVDGVSEEPDEAEQSGTGQDAIAEEPLALSQDEPAADSPVPEEQPESPSPEDAVAEEKPVREPETEPEPEPESEPVVSGKAEEPAEEEIEPPMEEAAEMESAREKVLVSEHQAGSGTVTDSDSDPDDGSDSVRE